MRVDITRDLNGALLAITATLTEQAVRENGIEIGTPLTVAIDDTRVEVEVSAIRDHFFGHEITALPLPSARVTA